MFCNARPQLHALGGRGGRRNAECQLDRADSGCYPEVFRSLPRQMVTMDTLAALAGRDVQLVRVEHHTLRHAARWLLHIKSGEKEVSWHY